MIAYKMPISFSFALFPPQPKQPQPPVLGIMKIDSTNFFKELLPLLETIADADFVAIDVEMTGIGLHCDKNPKREKPNLAGLYREAKTIADRYTIGQLGLSCIKKDPRGKSPQSHHNWSFANLIGVLIAKTYSIPVGIAIQAGFEVQRDFTVCSGAVEFLSSSGVDLLDMLSKGIRYLSRKEEAEAKRIFEGKIPIPDMALDDELLEFCAIIREEIIEWLQKPAKNVNDCLSIRTCSRKQKRAIHQLLRSDFRMLRAYSTFDAPFMMQIELKNEEREAKHKAGQKIVFDHQIKIARGLRYIYEALTGGDLSDLTPDWFCKGEWTSLETKKAEIARIQDKLKSKRHTLVGHNLFTDLLFLVRTFEGELPSSLSEFCKHMHKMCPTIFDTKYMATCTGDFSTLACNQYLSSTSSLLNLYKRMRFIELPIVESPIIFAEYVKKTIPHNAAYDAYMTAIIFVKMAYEMQPILLEKMAKDAAEKVRIWKVERFFAPFQVLIASIVSLGASGQICLPFRMELTNFPKARVPLPVLPPPFSGDLEGMAELDAALAARVTGLDQFIAQKLRPAQAALLAPAVMPALTEASTVAESDVEEEGKAYVGYELVHEPCWDIYRNKLRVYRVYGAVVDLVGEK